MKRRLNVSRYEKGAPFFNRRFTKGVPFLLKEAYIGYWYGPRGGASRIKRCGAPPSPRLLLLSACFCLLLTRGIAQKERNITVEATTTTTTLFVEYK